ncbi:MAG TPA: hypothetical protein VG204_10705 [Terriglobia bacterium]|nr:hypothetical protein [Terriglobia bacterium]
MTVDEELARLEENLRRLKIEYEVYFNGGSKRPPRDTVYRVDSTIKKFSNEASNLSIGQRFKFNQLVQRYAVHSDLWRRKLREREEGREQVGPVRGEAGAFATRESWEVVVADPEGEGEKVGQVVEALMAAERQSSEPPEVIDPMALADAARERIRQVKESTGARRVRVSVSVRQGKVSFDVVPSD